jgi:hypothetical protein
MGHALQNPQMTIHITMKNAQEIETNAIDFSKHLKVKIACQRSDVMERHLTMWIKYLYQHHIPISLTLIQEKIMSIHGAETEEFEEQGAAKVKPFDA